jgi:type VI secretion system secreted protein Hcp
MPIDMFLRITGPEIKGESSDKIHQDQIDVLAWSWGASQSGTTHMGHGSGAGKAYVQDLSLTKYVDRSSVDLLMHVMTGKHIELAEFWCRTPGINALEFLIFEFKRVIVSSYSTGGSGGEDRFTENVTLNFAEYRIRYAGQNEKGETDPKKKDDFSWSIAENREK